MFWQAIQSALRQTIESALPGRAICSALIALEKKRETEILEYFGIPLYFDRHRYMLGVHKYIMVFAPNNEVYFHVWIVNEKLVKVKIDGEWTPFNLDFASPHEPEYDARNLNLPVIPQ